MATGMNTSPRTPQRKDSVNTTPRKTTNGTPMQSRHETSMENTSARGVTGTAPQTPAKHIPPKANVADIKIVAHWDIRGDDDESDPENEGLDSECTDGRAEVGLFAKITPLPGSTLEIMHLNKAMHVKMASYRAVPLLPDGTSPRETAGTTALGIPIVSGRYRRTADGKVKLSRQVSSGYSSQDEIVNPDGIYESDGENSTSSGDTINSSIAAILSPEVFLDGSFSIVGSHGEDGDEDAMSKGSQQMNDADKWLESYNSGTQLTVNAAGYLCIVFDESIRGDALVVEVFLEVEPIGIPQDPSEESAFIFAGLPIVKRGIDVVFTIHSRSVEHEWIFKSEPLLSGLTSLNNTLCGRYFNTGDTTDNVLVIRSLKVDRLQKPTDYSVELLTRVTYIPYLRDGYVAVIYKITAVLNNTQYLETEKRSRLIFKVLNVLERDNLEIEGETGWEWTSDGEDCGRVDVTRPVSQTFNDINIIIVAQRSLDSLGTIKTPKIIPDGGFVISESVLLEELGDQPLVYNDFDKLTLWKKANHDEDSKTWTRGYQLLEVAKNPEENFTFGIRVNETGFPEPGLELSREVENEELDLVSYSVFPKIKGKMAKVGSFTVQMTMAYHVDKLNHNERVFTIASGKWVHDETSLNDRLVAHGVFHPCNPNHDLWVVLNNEYGRQGGPVVMKSRWKKNCDLVLLAENGEVFSSEEHFRKHRKDGMDTYDKYFRLDVPYLADKYAEVDCDIQYQGVRSAGPSTSRILGSPFHFGTPVSKLMTLSRESPSSPNQIYQDFLISRTSERLRWKNPDPTRHMRRKELLGEVHRDGEVYITRRGMRVFIYIPQAVHPKPTEMPPQMKGKLVKEFEGPISRSLTDGLRGPMGRSHDEQTITEAITRSGNDSREKPALVGRKSTNDDGPRIPQCGPLRMPKIIESSNINSSDGASPACNTTPIPLSLTPSPERIDGEGFTREITTTKIVETRNRSKKRRIAEVKGSPQNIDIVQDVPLQTHSLNYRAMVVCRYILLIVITFIAIASFLETRLAREELRATNEEMYQLKNQMRVFRNIFEGVYGVSFGDARWKRVRINQDVDVVVLVRGPKESQQSFIKIPWNDPSQIDRDAYWEERIREKEEFIKKRLQHSQNANQQHGNRLVDGDNGRVKQLHERTADFKALATKQRGDIMALSHSTDQHLYPWEGVKNMLANALGKSGEIAGEAVHVVKDSWTEFLRLWRAVWYMT